MPTPSASPRSGQEAQGVPRPPQDLTPGRGQEPHGLAVIPELHRHGPQLGQREQQHVGQGHVEAPTQGTGEDQVARPLLDGSQQGQFQVGLVLAYGVALAGHACVGVVFEGGWRHRIQVPQQEIRPQPQGKAVLGAAVHGDDPVEGAPLQPPRGHGIQFTVGDEEHTGHWDPSQVAPGWPSRTRLSNRLRRDPFALGPRSATLE